MARVVVMTAGTSCRRREELGTVLGGEDRVIELEGLLERRAREWAQTVATADGSVESGTELELVIADADGSPTIVIWPELPVWQADTGTDALQDLAASCAVAIGPVFDGALYLLAFAEPIPELASVAAQPWRGARAMTGVFEVVQRRELMVGLLRAERGLRHPDDIAALRADPRTDAELRELLG